MDRGFDRLRTKMKAEGLDWPLLLQGTGSKNELLERFRRSPNAILVASQSFWEGVDVKGDALRLVIIEKLPFSSPDDALTKARIEHLKAKGGNAFREYQLPEAALALKQGAGRLLRDVDDAGIVAVLDRRLITRAYGQTFLRSLPKVRRFGELGAVEAWWRGGVAGGGAVRSPAT